MGAQSLSHWTTREVPDKILMIVVDEFLSPIHASSPKVSFLTLLLWRLPTPLGNMWIVLEMNIFRIKPSICIVLSSLQRSSALLSHVSLYILEEGGTWRGEASYLKS